MAWNRPAGWAPLPREAVPRRGPPQASRIGDELHPPQRVIFTSATPGLSGSPRRSAWPVRARWCSGTRIWILIDAGRNSPGRCWRICAGLGFSGRKAPIAADRSAPTSNPRDGPLYIAAFQQLLEQGALYPCRCSRREVQQALQAPHQGEEEPVYPGTCRNNRLIASGELPLLDPRPAAGRTAGPAGAAQLNWRFRVPEGEEIRFVDGAQGPQAFMAGRDFGDFVVWRQDDVPSYQLAVVVDDAAMQITEVVRGADLLLSTARQLLLLRALGWRAPSHHHCPLMVDEKGVRLAKRHDSLSLRSIRGQGVTPESLRAGVLFAQ